MNPLPEYLAPLVYLTRPFPQKAVEAAIAHREECTPHLLHALEWADENPAEANDANRPYMLHLFALYLLAQFREKRAYPLIVRLFRNEAYEELTGDLVSESLDKILASVCGGDTSLIEGLIEDRTADEWVRGAAVGSLGVLIQLGAKSREEISAYFGRLFASRVDAEPNHVWERAIAVCADYGMAEHLEEIERLFEEGMINLFFDLFEDIEMEITRPPEESAGAAHRWYEPIDDTIAEMSWWDCFNEESDMEDLDEPIWLNEGSDAIPVVRDSPKIGRNDPCPCGSGRKYKKCCGKPGTA
jgi:hypothetical protein